MIEWTRFSARDASATSVQFVALFGLGGIGKSSIAAQDMEQERKIKEKKYNDIFWVYGETTALLQQSFTDIALQLRLLGAQSNLHNENLIQSQSWFQTTGKPLTFGIVGLV